MKLLVALIGACLALLGLGAVGSSFFLKPDELQAKEPQLSFQCPPYLMSCAYKTYKDPAVLGGRFWTAKTVLENPGESSYHDLQIRYRIPGIVEWSDVQSYPEVLPGQSVVNCYYPDLPDSITDRRTSDREVINIELSYLAHKGDEQRQLINRNMPIRVLGISELAYTDIPSNEIQRLADHYATSFFTACFVTPDDPIIRYLTQRIQSLMGGSSANSGDPQQIENFMRATYDVLAAMQIRYGGTTGLPLATGGVETTIQTIRLPREIVTGSAGLCIELSNLFCSIFESEGLDSTMFLTNNHAWPAVMLPNGNFLPVESTMLGEASFDIARQQADMNTQAFLNGGQALFQDNEGNTHTVEVVPMGVISIKEYHAGGIAPIELRDAPDLRRRLDDVLTAAEPRLPNWPWQEPRQQAQAPANQDQAQTPPEANEGNGIDLTSALGLTITVPANFEVTRAPLAQIPLLDWMAIDPTDSFGVSVYSDLGNSDVGQFFQNLNAEFNSVGMSLADINVDVLQEGGNIWTCYGSTVGGDNFGDVEWGGFLVVGADGVHAVIYSADPGQLNSWQSLIEQISNTLH